MGVDALRHRRRSGRSIGDTSWIVEARRSGKIQALIVQGILATDLSRAADIVRCRAHRLPRRTRPTPTTRVCCVGASRALNAPGDAQEDWQILVKLAAGLGVTLAYGSGSVDIRQDISARLAAAAAEGMSTLSFRGRCRPARGSMRLTRQNAGSGSSSIRTCHRSGLGRTIVTARAGSHPSQRSEVVAFRRLASRWPRRRPSATRSESAKLIMRITARLAPARRVAVCTAPLFAQRGPAKADSHLSSRPIPSRRVQTCASPSRCNCRRATT